MGFFDDPRVSGAAGGALSGGATGFAIGGPIGAGIGAIGGGLLGLFGGGAQKSQQDSMAAARAQLQEAARQSYAQRMQDLDRGMAYFQPVNANLRRLYGAGAAMPPQTYAQQVPQLAPGDIRAGVGQYVPPPPGPAGVNRMFGKS